MHAGRAYPVSGRLHTGTWSCTGWRTRASRSHSRRAHASRSHFTNRRLFVDVVKSCDFSCLGGPARSFSSSLIILPLLPIIVFSLPNVKSFSSHCPHTRRTVLRCRQPAPQQQHGCLPRACHSGGAYFLHSFIRQGLPFLLYGFEQISADNAKDWRPAVAYGHGTFVIPNVRRKYITAEYYGEQISADKVKGW